MKSFREQNYYELLDLSPDADPELIAKAYTAAKRTFSGNSLATYSLFDAAERDELLARLEEAHRTLSDPQRKARYDKDVLGIHHPQRNSDDVTAGGRAPTGGPVFTLAELAPDDVTGSVLRARREAIGVPLQEIARTTRISIVYLQFIEEDREKGLPHDTYLRGYLTQYARALGLDPQLVADGYLRHLKTLRTAKQ